MKRISLERGGHAPFIVFPDADPKAVAKAAVMGKFRNNGQACISPSQFFVHKEVEKQFTEAAVGFARGLKLGDGLEPGAEVGPMFEERAMHHTVELIEDAKRRGAKVLTGGQRSKRFDRGYFFEPTVLATPQCPFGGMKESGLGRELAHEGLEANLETKYVSIKLRDA
jgi:succinate-semialdehyde dehydrogenase/glutarate-semialdehyde dehydrogenase